jgi:N-acetylmuramoyl-L-alanine amidase
MKLSRGLVDPTPYQKARHIGGAITPTILIVHDTAGRLDKGNSAAFLRDNAAGVSIHFVVERDGSIVQQVPVNRRANHAGRSSYHGRPDCNAFSIGIEIVNPGRMTAAPGGKARAWWGELFDVAEYGIEEAAPATHGPGWWMAYTPEQLAAVEQLAGVLVSGLGLIDIVPHWYVAPGRKADTNPLFPLEAIKARALGRDDPAQAEADRGAVSNIGLFVRIDAPNDTVNLRRWPSFNPNVIAAIPDGAVVPVLAGKDGWFKVLYGGQEGWVVERYTTVVAR